MKNKEKEIIYIGKAKALKNRVSQYFGSINNHSEKVIQMVSNVFDFDYIITDSEFEALVLEASLIKQHKPKYNILLKDDKGYSYIKITKNPWKKLSVCFQKDNKDCDYIGPYYSHYIVNQSFLEAVNIFKIPTCNRNFPQDFKKARPCLNYHIKQCMGVCRGNISFEEYSSTINDIIDFLKGGSSLSLKKLTEDMQNASENLEFERAAKIRDRIKSIKRMQEKQKVFSKKVKEQDVFATASDGKHLVYEVFRFKDGMLKDTEFFTFNTNSKAKATSDNKAVSESEQNYINEAKEHFSEFLVQFYTIRNDVPKNVTLEQEINDSEILEKWLSEKKGKRVYITVPKIGEQAQIVQMCKNNALEQLAQMKSSNVKEYSVLEELRKILNLEKLPEYIESYDISNTAGSENVAGMIVYKNGKPFKQSYRKFKIKSFSGQDDYASMTEVLTRRFNEYVSACENSDKNTDNNAFAVLPDLILLDGGKGQVSVVKNVLKKFNLDIPLFGMVKDDKHKTRALTTESEEVSIQTNKPVFSFVTKVQDEVHRFAIGYHKQRRSKSSFKSSLTEIDGIGQERAKALLKYFRTVSGIKRASIEELEKAPKMNRTAAEKVFYYFNK